MKCFVIMPFGNPKVDPENARRLDSIYTRWIKPTVESINIPESNERISCHRADKTYKPGEIISHIIENLITSDIVIADLSGKNANVFYELGVRHAVGNNCILIADNIDDIPFDLRSLRTIVYQYEPESMLGLKEALQNAIDEILKDPNGIDNPVRRFIYNKELNDTVKQSSSEAALVKNVLSEMASLRNEFNAQTNEIRQIMNLITSRPVPNAVTSFDIRSLDGIWVDKGTQSRFYVRTFNGEPFVAYTFGNVKELTGYVYNFRIIDKTIFGRFEWFELPVSGYIFLKVEAELLITGGWWYSSDVPREVINDLSKVNDSIPGMNRLYVEKVSSEMKFPPYIEQYFRKKINQM